jgi:peptidoglycan/LPS O-acetylase OafA/YrhL
MQAPDGSDVDPAGDQRIVYRADLDGLRAVAVGLVMLAHAKWPVVLNGGDAGVTAFFVLSGYLITSILVAQRERTGKIDVLAFYRRRFIRLAPALAALIVFTLIIGLTVGLRSNWQAGILSCLVYVSNWAQVFGIAIDPLGHTWSLAIEEQFYLVWPAMVILFGRRLLRVAIIGIVLIAFLRLVSTGYLEYFSTITRADAILVGCVVAITRPRWSATIGAIGLAVLIFIAPLSPEHDIALPIAMAATVAVIGGGLPQLGMLAAAGRRAYSLYLWNWPMTLLFGAGGILAVVMTILVGELSYRLLEAPFMRRRGEPMAAPQRLAWGRAARP